MSGITTLGISFIDENVRKEDAAIYIGKVCGQLQLSLCQVNSFCKTKDHGNTQSHDILGSNIQGVYFIS